VENSTDLRLFLDTNILVSASFWRGASYKLLLRAIDGRILGFTSMDILSEYRKVLKRDFHLHEEEVDSRIAALMHILIVVFPSRHLEIIADDPSDDRVLEGALEAGADFVVTNDRHLLKLGVFRGIKIVKPENIL
jgi:putative PIN family toxin of toxin-antitoxin system